MLPLVAIVAVVAVVLSSTLKHVQYASSRPLKLSIRDLLWEAVTCTLESRNGQITIRCTATLQSIVSLQISLLFPWTVRGKSAARTRRVSTSTATKGHLKSCPGLPGTTPHDLVHDLRHHPQAEKNTTNKKRERGATPRSRGASMGDIGSGFCIMVFCSLSGGAQPTPTPSTMASFPAHRVASSNLWAHPNPGVARGPFHPRTNTQRALCKNNPIEWCLALAAEPSAQREKRWD